MATEPVLGSGGKKVQEPRLKGAWFALGVSSAWDVQEDLPLPGLPGEEGAGGEGAPRCPGARVQADADSVSPRVSPRRCRHRED